MKSTNTSPVVETPARFFIALTRLIQDGEIVSSGPVPSRRMVVKCGVVTIAKLVWGTEEFTDIPQFSICWSTNLTFQHLRPLGLLRMGNVSILFISYLPGTTLEAVWADLAADQ